MCRHRENKVMKQGFIYGMCAAARASTGIVSKTQTETQSEVGNLFRPVMAPTLSGHNLHLNIPV